MKKSNRSVGQTTHTGGVDETIPTGGVDVTILIGVAETIHTGVDERVTLLKVLKEELLDKTIPTGVDERVHLLNLLKDELLDAEIENVRLILAAKRYANANKRAEIDQHETELIRTDRFVLAKTRHWNYKLRRPDDCTTFHRGHR